MRVTSPRHLAGALGLGAALLAGGCAQSAPLDDAEQRVEKLLTDQPHPVRELLVTQEWLAVSLLQDGQATLWELFPEVIRRDPNDTRVATMAPDDFPVASTLARARKLSDECTADTYEASAVVASGTAVLTSLKCGDAKPALLLNDRKVETLDGGWTAENLSTVWQELKELTAQTEVESIFFDGEQMVVGLLPEAGRNSECRPFWSRDLIDSENTFIICRKPRPASETFDLDRITPERLGGAILGAQASLGIPYDTVLDSVEVTTRDGEPVLSVRHVGRTVIEPLG